MKAILKLSGLSLAMLLTSVSVSTNALAADAPGRCTGTSAGCDTISADKCTDQTGCFAKIGEAKCTGIPLGCGLITDMEKCGKQSGCNWIA